MATTTFRDHTRALLAQRPVTDTLDRIAEQTGLSRRWLTDFGSGTTEDAGVNKVQTLYEYLAKKELQF